MERPPSRCWQAGRAQGRGERTFMGNRLEPQQPLPPSSPSPSTIQSLCRTNSNHGNRKSQPQLSSY